MEHWVEHYSELYFRDNVVAEDALNAIGFLSVLEKLDRDSTIKELSMDK